MLPNTSLHYFYEVAQTGSVRQAAEQLHISPSAISRMIKKLEHRFHTPLFERKADGMRLTPAGDLLYAQLDGIYAQIQDVEVRIDELQGLRRGKVAIHCIEGVMYDLAPRFLSAFHKTYPGITFSVSFGSTQDIVSSLLTYTSDIGITFNMKKHAGIEIIRTFRHPLYLLVAPDHELAEQPVMSLRQLGGFKIAMPNASFGIRQIFDRALRSLNISLGSLVTSNSLLFSRSMARTGTAITFSSIYVAQAELAAHQLVAIPLLESELLTGATYLCKHADRQLSASATELISYIEDAFPD